MLECEVKKTFKKWDFINKLGHETKTIDDVVYVVKVWCKACAAQKGNFLAPLEIRGVTKELSEWWQTLTLLL